MQNGEGGQAVFFRLARTVHDPAFHDLFSRIVSLLFSRKNSYVPARPPPGPFGFWTGITVMYGVKVERAGVPGPWGVAWVQLS
jgi:hypothetical protein